MPEYHAGEPPLRRHLPKLVERLSVLPGRDDISLSTNATQLHKHAHALLPPVRLKWQARVVLTAYALLLALALTMGALLMLTLFRYRRELIPVLLARRAQHQNGPKS